MHDFIISYRIDTTDEHTVEAHLRACDTRFMSLSADADALPAYAKKLASRARRCEAWAGQALVGLVALYCNDSHSRTAFISNVSVLPDWGGKGIATRLLGSATELARLAGMHEIRLEVDRGNVRAIGLYRKAGYAALPGASPAMSMARLTDS